MKNLRFYRQQLLVRMQELVMLPREKMWWRCSKDLAQLAATPAPVFVIGAPRSGTTLLSQVIINAFKIGYINNRMAAYPKTPVTAAKRFRSMFTELPVAAFQSDFGRTSGPHGAHEAAEFWYRWFPRGMHVYADENSLTAKQSRQFGDHVRSLSLALNLPVMFKNTYNSMRIKAIARALPNAIFVICHRDPVDNAQSLLNARKKAGDINAWWSVPPREVAQIKQLPYYQQVVDQVYAIEKQMKADERSINNGRFIHVQYRDVCESPETVMQTLQYKCRKLGLELERRLQPLPDAFNYSTGCKINPNDYEKIQKRVEVLWQT